MKTRSIRGDMTTLLLLCLVISSIVCWGAFGAPDGALLGSRHIDALGSYWFQWFVAHQVELNSSLSQTDLWFHPWGIDILQTYGGNIIDPIIALPFRAIGGPALAWNALVFLILLTNGLSAGAWLRMRTGTVLAASAAASLAMLHPMALNDLAEGRPAQAILAPLIGALALFDASNRCDDLRRSRWLAIGSGLCIGLAAICYWFGGLFAALAVAVLALGRDSKPRVIRLLLAASACLITIGPLLFSLLATVGSGAGGALLPIDTWWSGELALTTSAGDHITLCTLDESGSALKTLRDKTQSGAPLVGLISLLAISVTVRGAWRFTLVAVLGLAIALGPMPWGFRNPVYLSLALLPGMDRLYWPCRAAVLTLPVAALGGGLLVQLLTRPRARVAGVMAIIGLSLVEVHARSIAPLETWQTDAPSMLKCLADSEGAAITLPYGRDHEHLIHQTLHERPLLGGARERSNSLVPEEQQDFVKSNPWIQELMVLTRNPRAEFESTEADESAVYDHGYRWVIVRWDDLPRPAQREGRYKRERLLESAMTAHLGEPVQAQGGIRIYAPWGDELECEVESAND